MVKLPRLSLPVYQVRLDWLHLYYLDSAQWLEQLPRKQYVMGSIESHLKSSLSFYVEKEMFKFNLL